MKEININIEGYNVNGICVGCLNYNRKMFYDNEIQECLKNLAEIDVPDGLSVMMCWECSATARAVNRFREQILRSYDVLIDYSRKNTFLNSPDDLSQYATQRLSACSLDTFSYPQRIECKDEELSDVSVKPEMEDLPGQFDEDLTLDPIDMKSEADLEQEQDTLSDGFVTKNEYTSDEDVQLKNEYTSDEDVQLSQLKKQKEKKVKKRKKEKKSKTKVKEIIKEEPPKPSRKLKNLPENLVELYTMSEAEMWQIRSEDLESKEFANLKYKCDDCIIGFNTEKLMNDHMSGKHRPKSEDCQQCDVCKAYLLTKDNLSVHRSLHLTAFKCKECGVKTALKRNMIKHVRTHCDNEEHRCPTCGKAFSTRSKLSYHKNVCHQEKPQCDCCGKVFANKMTLKYHLKLQNSSQNKEEKPKEKLYLPCKGCNKVFHNKKSYRAHVVIHNGLTYPCPICGKLFQWKRNLARHTRNHREREIGALHECRQCEKTFSSRDCYNNHMRLSKRHVPENAYGHECNYCGKKFATKWCMVDHIDWDHLKRIKYQCSVCFKAFKTAKIMVAHMNNIHEGKKREPEGEHLCEICGKSYKTVKRLKGHVWAMHTNRSTTKSFKCKLCPATFTWQTSIYKHNKMMHSTPKRNKQQPPRQLATVKKQEPLPYPEIELDGSRMPYFTHVPTDITHLQPHIGIVQNIA